ncbi:FHA domain-containing protein [Ktedonosporobacter rubrisoli]|uniref:FHA domain-containing protein n=1 Tax=Ktedonosporobacter rubrisoli TaxID=2509675 RepID=A0A4V0Z028_KTERU|nr:FHA domain-containing protein [Ktedonosporobacter rubrisoli]QBD81771.1 FHA domain-containing protein [Ktedonosporobacter rubrisoli]
MAQENLSGAYLVIQKGPQLGKRVELWKECTTIGRSRECDIFLEDIAVHRKQARILLTPAGYILRDDHGSGDSYVNGRPVQEQLLNSNDQLLFGNTQMTFFAHEGTRPFQFASSRGRELHAGKALSAQPASVACLDLISTFGDIRRIELPREMTIGRSRECDIFLEDLAVSRTHVTIHELPNGEYELLDNHSATGTFVNGGAMRRCILRDGDVVQIGASKFIFRLHV